MSDNNFLNSPSRKFFEFLQQKIYSKELTMKEIVEAFGSYQKNPSAYFNNLRRGHSSVTVEQILIAQEKFGLDPCSLFQSKRDIEGLELTTVQEFYAPYLNYSLLEHIGKIIKEIFKRHKTNVKNYAEQRLNMSEQNLHKQLRGEGRIAADTVITIAEDFAEPLEQFRRTPLPQGHLMEKIKLLEQLLDAKDQRIKELEAKQDKT